ncbi:MAG TPA: hypothetical protein QGF58_22155 [Myxococcota bacterium]|nr:hypothetical protein [Myxococcota bacterium]
MATALLLASCTGGSPIELSDGASVGSSGLHLQRGGGELGLHFTDWGREAALAQVGPAVPRAIDGTTEL